MRAARLLLGVALACALAVAWAAPAEAHALLTSSDPASGATSSTPPTEVVITFTEQPDPALSAIKVLDASGQTRADGRPQPVPGRANTLRIAVPRLPDGVYTVSWRTVSKVDGHLAVGSFSFGVGVSAANAPPPKASVNRSPRPSTFAVGARWVYFLGLVGLLGLAFTELVVLPPGRARRRVTRGALVTWVLAAAGTAGLTDAQRTTAHVPLRHLLASSLGHALRLRGIPVLAAGVFVVLTATAVGAQRARRLAMALVAAAVLAAMAGDAATGHAAAQRSWEWFRIGTQTVHLAAVGVWVGGLAGLLLCMAAIAPDGRREAARRYSLVAGVALVVVAVSGSVRAVDEIGSWHQLFTTGFGQLVIAKVALLLVLVVFGAFNRYRSLPALDRSTRRLRRGAGGELATMAVVLGLTAVLLNLAPARSSAAASAKPAAVHPIVVDAHDFATTVRVHLTVSPGTPGFDRVSLRVTDYDTGRVVRADRVAVGFHFPSRPDVGDSSLVLAAQPDGTYAAQGGNLSLLGRWQLTVGIQRGTESVDVPIQLVTQSPPHPLDVQRNAGVPTIYTIHLAGGRDVQVYLDPGRPGFNEFHATFLDTSGREIPISTFDAAEARDPDSSQTILTTRKLDDIGHYVADATLDRGAHRFTITAATPTGAALGAGIVIPVG
jgi:copper transport protein